MDNTTHEFTAFETTRVDRRRLGVLAWRRVPSCILGRMSHFVVWDLKAWDDNRQQVTIADCIIASKNETTRGLQRGIVYWGCARAMHKVRRSPTRACTHGTISSRILLCSPTNNKRLIRPGLIPGYVYGTYQQCTINFNKLGCCTLRTIPGVLLGPEIRRSQHHSSTYSDSSIFNGESLPGHAIVTIFSTSSKTNVLLEYICHRELLDGGALEAPPTKARNIGMLKPCSPIAHTRSAICHESSRRRVPADVPIQAGVPFISVRSSTKA